MASDITLAKEAELDLRRLVEERTAELTESEARFRAIFDAVMEVIVLLEPDGTVVEVNSTRAAWRAENARDAIGKPLWESPTLKRYPGYEPLLREAVATAAAGEIFTDRSEVRGAGASDRLPRHRRCSRCAARTARSAICCSKCATSPN